MLFLVLGLKINIHKTKLYGVGVSFDELEDYSLIIGCMPDKIPFNYIGLPVTEYDKGGWVEDCV